MILDLAIAHGIPDMITACELANGLSALTGIGIQTAKILAIHTKMVLPGNFRLNWHLKIDAQTAYDKGLNTYRLGFPETARRLTDKFKTEPDSIDAAIRTGNIAVVSTFQENQSIESETQQRLQMGLTQIFRSNNQNFDPETNKQLRDKALADLLALRAKINPNYIDPI